MDYPAYDPKKWRYSRRILTVTALLDTVKRKLTAPPQEAAMFDKSCRRKFSMRDKLFS